MGVSGVNGLTLGKPKTGRDTGDDLEERHTVAAECK